MGKNLADKLVKSESNKLIQKIINACQETKGQDLAVLDVKEFFDLSDYFVVVSGRSDRQVQGISNRILEDLASINISPVTIEGLEEGQWVLIDFGNIVVHVFYEATRAYYDFDGLWARAPRVNLNPESSHKKAKVAA
jgi:ribosome-associated protein